MSHLELTRKDKTHDLDVTGNISEEEPEMYTEGSEASLAAAVHNAGVIATGGSKAPEKKNLLNAKANVDEDIIRIFQVLAKKRQSTMASKGSVSTYDKKDTFLKIGACFLALYIGDVLFMWLLIESMLSNVEDALIAYIIIFAIYSVALFSWVIYETVIKVPEKDEGLEIIHVEDDDQM